MNALQTIDFKLIADTVVDEVNPERIILFGSLARNNYTEDSDIDLLVIKKEPFSKGRDRQEEILRIRNALKGFAIPFDILLYSLSEIENWKDSVNHIISICLRDGVVLYERP